LSVLWDWREPSVSTDVVLLSLPPPKRGVSPVYRELSVGTTLVRIFDPTRHNAEALTFRFNGPRARFDHHRGDGPARTPSNDPDRAVYYAAWSDDLSEALSSCLVEVFGDKGIVELGSFHVAMPRIVRTVRLLDLQGRGAMRAGTVAAIAKCDHRQSQPWSRYFFETESTYGAVDGLIYRNAHNDEPAVMLYERGQTALICHDDAVVRLDHPALQPLLDDLMRENQLTL
jgi:hypothetical protein